MRTPLRRTATAAAVALVLVACSNADGDGVSDPTPTDGVTATAASEDPAATASDQVTDQPSDPEAGETATDDAVIQTAVNFAFEHETLEVATGGTISFTVAEGSHSFTSTDAGFDTGVLSGDTVTVRVDAEPGTYTFRCTLHGQMSGELTVTE